MRLILAALTNNSIPFVYKEEEINKAYIQRGNTQRFIKPINYECFDVLRT